MRSSVAKFLLIGLSLPASILSAAAAAPAALHDLGKKLAYVRLEKLPGDATALIAAWPAPALIVDLRHAAGDAPENMEDDLPLRPYPEPIFALVSSATPAGVLALLRERATTLITLGPAAVEPRPDLPIDASPEADRRAYGAFAAGASLDSLVNERISKPRFDEAALLASRARERANGAENADAPVENPGSDVEGQAPPVDAVLQRAVQLHRALLALGRLPRH